MANIETRYSQIARHKGENTAVAIPFLMQAGKFVGTNEFPGGTL